MRKTKRLTALIVAVFLVIMAAMPIMNVLAAVEVADGVENVLSEKFEDQELDFSCDESNFVSYENYPYDTSLLYGKSLKYDVSSITSGMREYTILPSVGKSVFVEPENKSNFYSEISFDISVGSTGNTPFYVYLQGLKNSGGNTVFSYLHWNNGKVYARTSGGAKQIGAYEANKMYNIKWVIQWTGNDGAINQKTTAVYINGNLAANQSYPFPQDFDMPVKNLNAIKLSARANVFWIDNLNCITYSSSDGSSPVINASELKNQIQSCSALLSSSVYAKEDIEVFRKELVKAVEVYNTAGISAENVNKTLSNLKNAKFELRKMNDEYVYNENFSDATLWSNLSASGNYSITDYDADMQSELYGNAAKITVNSAASTKFEVRPNSGTLANNVDGTKLASISFDFKPWGIFKDMSMNIKVGGEKDNSNVFQMYFASQGTLDIFTVRNNVQNTYPGGTTTPITSSLRIAEGIDYSKMHNMTIVYGADEVGLGYPFTSIKGIYLDGEKLDYVDKTLGTVYPIAMPQTRMNTVWFEISHRPAQYDKYGYWVDNVKAALHTDGVLPVLKAKLKAAINDIESIYADFGNEQKAVVAEKLNRAKTMYYGNTYGQVACDNMTDELLKAEYIEQEFINECLSFDVKGVTNSEAVEDEFLADLSGVYDNCLRWDLTLKKAGKTYTYDIKPLAENGSFAHYSEGKEMYVSISFDLALSKTDVNPFYIKLMNGLAEESGLDIIFYNKKIYINSLENEPLSTGGYEDRKMMHINIVMQMSDNNGARNEKIRKILINGVNLLDSDVDASKMNGRFDLIRLSANKTTEKTLLGCFVDNLDMDKSFGIIPSDMKYELLNLIKGNVNLLHRRIFPENDMLDDAIANGIEVYKNSKASNDDITEACDDIVYALIQNGVEFKTVTMNSDYSAVTGAEFIKNVNDEREYNVYIASYDKDGRTESVTGEKITALYGENNAVVDFEELLVEGDSGDLRIFLWDNGMKPLADSEEIMFYPLESWNIYVNDNLIYPDVPVSINVRNKDIMVPVKNLLNNMGIEVIKNGNSYRGETPTGESLILYENSSVAIVNGVEKTMSSPTYLAENMVIMAPYSVIAEAFGANIIIDNENSQVDVNYTFPTDLYKSSWYIYVEQTWQGDYSVGYKISGIDNNAEVEVFYKDYELNTTRRETQYYHKAVSPVRVTEGNKTSFVGGIGELRQNHSYSLIIKVTQDGIVNYYNKNLLGKYKLKTNSYPDWTYDEMAKGDGTEISLVPTYENISYYINYEADKCDVSYREVGTETWKKAYSPYVDPYISGNFRGSIVRLNENTQYEVKADLYDENANLIKTLLKTVRTKNENPTIAKTINLSEIYSGEGSLMIAGLKGTESGWIKIVNDTDITIYGDDRCKEAVMVVDCQYLIIDGLKIKNGQSHGMTIIGSSSDIIVKNCDISEYGRVGVYNDKTNYYMLDGAYVEKNAGIYMTEVDNITVTDCYFHDCRATTNAWSSDTVETAHPHGGSAIYYLSEGQCVIKNNKMLGDENHWWEDAILGECNADLKGGAGRDTDIYGNEITFCLDDSCEIDGAGMNVRFYDNIVNETYQGISVAPVYVGPMYIYNNLIVSDQGIKSGGLSDGRLGVLYLFGNTVLANGNNLRNVGVDGTDEYHAVTRNNILFSAEGVAIYNSKLSEWDSNQNDMLWGITKTNSNDMSYELFAMPDFEEGSYILKDGSPGKGSAVRLDNFNETNNADIGCSLKK